MDNKKNSLVCQENIGHKKYESVIDEDENIRYG
jgi:hypothetical protein